MTDTEKQSKALMCKSYYYRKTSNLQEPRAGECDVEAQLESPCTHI